ncbi:universal stress protein [Mycolicibacterium iranicum]|uniref:UspA domain-containing protein n=1 Tax=Mycolicibacterium iranicum TaxID=912594 RepID=A0A178LYY1_MYCIR|nr:universal stress protein [Mycolicibacterium iranicum]OAN39881.1 hypothetical protein A4X20_16140 [Mycolicibacterium iranicum]
MSEGTSSRGIVVGTDGSASAMTAVRWAAGEAKMRNIPLTILHVVEETRWPAQGGQIPDEVLSIAENQESAVIAEAVAAARGDSTDGELELETSCPPGQAVGVLIDSSRQSEMIAVGSRGLTGRHRRSIGSIAVGLLHHAHCPVAVVHDEAAAGANSHNKPVLVGIDGSRASLVAAATAMEEASRRGVGLLALHVCKDDAESASISGSRRAALESEAEALLRDSLAELRQRYPEVAVHLLVRFAAPARQILNQAERAQLVVVGSHGRGALTGALLGSVSTTVAKGAHIPVLVTRQS